MKEKILKAVRKKGTLLSKKQKLLISQQKYWKTEDNITT